MLVNQNRKIIHAANNSQPMKYGQKSSHSVRRFIRSNTGKRTAANQQGIAKCVIIPIPERTPPVPTHSPHFLHWQLILSLSLPKVAAISITNPRYPFQRAKTSRHDFPRRIALATFGTRRRPFVHLYRCSSPCRSSRRLASRTRSHRWLTSRRIVRNLCACRCRDCPRSKVATRAHDFGARGFGHSIWPISFP